MAIKKATIEEVSTSGVCHEYCAKVGLDGFVGDQTKTPGITILNAEVPHYLNTEFGEFLLAGQLGDNILIKDLGHNITNLPLGTRLLIRRAAKAPGEMDVVLRMKAKAVHYTKERFPEFSPQMFEYLSVWGGGTFEVVEGFGQLVCDGQEIEILDEEELKGAA